MKSRFLLLAAVIVSLFTSCSYNEVTPVKWDVFTIDIPSGAWVQQDEYLAATVKVPELTKTVCNDGMVQCYLVYSDGSQTLLPALRLLAADLKDDAGNFVETMYYQRLIDYEFSPGQLTVYYTMSDYYYDEDWPGDMKARLVLQH